MKPASVAATPSAGASASYWDLIQAKARYCRLLDTKDWSALAQLLTEDIEFNLSDESWRHTDHWSRQSVGDC